MKTTSLEQDIREMKLNFFFFKKTGQAMIQTSGVLLHKCKISKKLQQNKVNK